MLARLETLVTSRLINIVKKLISTRHAHSTRPIVLKLIDQSATHGLTKLVRVDGRMCGSPAHKVLVLMSAAATNRKFLQYALAVAQESGGLLGRELCTKRLTLRQQTVHTLVAHNMIYPTHVHLINQLRDFPRIRVGRMFHQEIPARCHL